MSFDSLFTSKPFYSHERQSLPTIFLAFAKWCLFFKQVNVWTMILTIFVKSVTFHSIPLACAYCDDSLSFSGASSIPLRYVLFPATLLHQPFFHPPSLHLIIYFLVYLSFSLFPNLCTCMILFWELYFLAFSVHAQTNVIYLTLLSLL